MTKILHSFTLYEHASELIRTRSKKGEMSDNVSKAIIWYYTEPRWSREYNEDGEYTGKLVPGHYGQVIAPYERKKYQEIIATLNSQIDDLKEELIVSRRTLRNNRFKFWKKYP